MGLAGSPSLATVAAPRRRLGRAATLLRLLQATAYVRPGIEPIGALRTCTHFMRCAAHLGTFRDWFGNPDQPALQEALARRPSLVNCVVHPYLNAHWDARRKLAVIGRHYAMLHGKLAFLRFAPGRHLRLGVVEQGLDLRLDKPAGFEHEGELNLSLFSGTTCLYTLAFTLGQTATQRLAYVGALQGRHSDDALASYRTLTHSLHGLRPRDLLIDALRMLAAALGLTRILAVGNTGRVSSQSYFSACTQVHASYDSAWSDAHGRTGAEDFFELDPGHHERDAQDIPARKRAQYRRRYAMLTALARQIEHSVLIAGHGDSTTQADAT